jgi:intracellular sulfur oxidation DsrE/DsrF family protein
MNYKLFLLSIGLFIASIIIPQHAFAQAKNKSAKHKIVMQLTSADTLVYAGLFKQLKNLKEGWGETVTIEVVCHGPGINLLHSEKSTFSNQLQAFTDKGIKFIACENTLKERNITKDKILPMASFVLMGIGEIVEKQEKGWSYIKAGF